MIASLGQRAAGRITLLLTLGLLTGCASANQSGIVGPAPFDSVPTSAEPGQSTITIPTATSALPTLDPTPDPTPAYDPFNNERPISQTAFIIPPTIQHINATSAQILFELESPQPGVVIFRPIIDDGAFSQTVRPLDTTIARHSLLLENLAESTRYEMLVRLGNGPLETMNDVSFLGERWGLQTFRTPPYGPDVRFAVIGDSGFGEPLTAQLAEQIARAAPDFVLHVGDVVYRAEEQNSPYEAYALKYYAPFANILKQAPIYPALGNHDANDLPSRLEGQPFYYRAFTPIHDATLGTSDFEGLRKWYAFAIGDIQFLALDSQTFFGDAGRVEQQVWLEERLADPRFAYTIPFFHVPPFSNTFHQGGSAAVRSWLGLFDQHRVPLAISGHNHNYARFIFGSTTYVVTGGGSQSLYQLEERDPNNQFFASRSHFLLVDLTAQQITVRAIGVNDIVIEEISIPVP